jgi:thymidylate synthase (FAD)
MPNYKGELKSVDVLDHGFVVLHNIAGPTRRIYSEYSDIIKDDNGFPVGIERDYDADDVDPAQCARMSFSQMGSERTYEEDMKLNEYLLKNEHTSPFEMIQVWIEVKVPIFIDRHMVRHRTWRRNESSGRYITLPADWYIPEIVGGKAPDKKQGQEDNLSSETQVNFKHSLELHCRQGYDCYKEAISLGVAPEHARMFLSVNHYVHWIGNVDLANLFRFLRLRTHSHAQIEAQRYAEAIVTLLRPHLPGLMDLFDKYVRK